LHAAYQQITFWIEENFAAQKFSYTKFDYLILQYKSSEIMKSLKFIQLLIFVILLQPRCFAGTKSGNAQEVHFLKKEGITNQKKPRAPSRQHITCYYENGQIHLSFNIYESYATLSIEDEIGEIYDITPFDTALPMIYSIGEFSNNLVLKIETDYGNIYEGYLTY